MPPFPPDGRLLAVDFGTVRVGLAVSNADRTIASPLTTYQRRTSTLDAIYFRQLTADERVVAIVVGLPVHLSGRESQKSAQARAYGDWLAEITQLPVVFHDERFSTSEAAAALESAGLSHKKRRARRDQLAAQIILASFLERGSRGQLFADDAPRALDDAPQ